MMSGDQTESIELSVSPSVKALLQAAAQSHQTTIDEFLLVHGIAAAKQALDAPRVFYASDEGWAAIQRMLDDEDAQVPDAATLDALQA